MTATTAPRLQVDNGYVPPPYSCLAIEGSFCAHVIGNRIIEACFFNSNIACQKKDLCFKCRLLAFVSIG